MNFRIWEIQYAGSPKPVFPILGAFGLKGQSKRDDGMIFGSCGACQLPVYPSGRSRTWLRIRGIMGAVPTINTTLGACEGLDVVVAMVVSPRPERAGQADQDGRPSGAARAAIDLSVVRGVGSLMVVPGSVGSYRPVIAGAKLREGTTTI